MRNILGFFYGLVYGVAHVIPGLSGGTFLVIFGCYDMMCEAFALNIARIKKDFLFYLFFGVGTVSGIVGFVHIITFLLDGFAIPTNLFFMGLILGGLPLITNIATREEKFRPICLLPFALGLALVISLFLMEKLGVFTSSAATTVDFMFMARIALYAFIAAIAMVMPGISGAFVLVAFGVYDLFLEGLKGFDFAILIPAVIGILLGIVVGAKLILLLMKRWKLMVYSAIIGMVIGSVAPLFPIGFGLNFATFAGIVCLALGALIAIILGKRESQQNNEKPSGNNSNA